MTEVGFNHGAVRRRGQGAGAGDRLAMTDWAEALAYDRAHLWHPDGSMTDPPPPRLPRSLTTFRRGGDPAARNPRKTT